MQQNQFPRNFHRNLNLEQKLTHHLPHNRTVLTKLTASLGSLCPKDFPGFLSRESNSKFREKTTQQECHSPTPYTLHTFSFTKQSGGRAGSILGVLRQKRQWCLSPSHPRTINPRLTQYHIQNEILRKTTGRDVDHANRRRQLDRQIDMYHAEQWYFPVLYEPTLIHCFSKSSQTHQC